MATITQKPPSFLLSKQPAYFVLTTVATGTLVTATISIGATQIGVDKSYSSLDKKAIFEFSEYFDTQLNPIISVLSEEAPVVQLNGGHTNPFSKTFTIIFSETGSADVTSTHHVIKGRITDMAIYMTQYAAIHTEFTQFLDGNGVALTTKPHVIRLLHPDQPERLYIPIYREEMESSFTIKITLYLADGTTHQLNNITITSPSAGSIWELKTSFSALIPASTLESLDEELVYYSVQIFQSTTAITFPYLYFVDFKQNKDIYCFLFRNTLGGFDTFATLDVFSIDHTNEKSLSPLAWSATTQQAPFYIAFNNSNTEFKVSTGGLNRNGIRHLHELIDSDQVYFTNLTDIEKTLFPVIFVKNSLRIRSIDNELFTAVFSFVLNVPMIIEKESA